MTISPPEREAKVRVTVDTDPDQLPLKSGVNLVTSVGLYPEDQKLPPGFGTSMLTLTTLIVTLLI